MAFPAISTGAYGFPAERATRIAVATTAEFLEDSERPREVIFVCFGKDMADLYESALAALD